MDHHLHTFSLLFSLLVVSFWIDHNSSSVGYLWCLMVYSQHLHHICKLLCQHYQYSPKKLSSPKSKSKISNPKIQGFGLWLTIKLLGPPTTTTHPPPTFKSIKPVQIQSLKSFKLWVHHFQQNFTLLFQDLPPSWTWTYKSFKCFCQKVFASQTKKILL